MPGERKTIGDHATSSEPTNPHSPTHTPLNLFQLSLAASLALSSLLAALFSLHWPLVGDASLIHYIAFLIERGWAPYRQLGDMNMPGAFLVELAAMHLFGPGALAWRLFDFSLALAATASFVSILRPANLPAPPMGRPTPGSPSWAGPHIPQWWLAPLVAGALFFLIHTRDGLAQGGQRDLTMAVTLLAATAFLIRAINRGSPLDAAAFALLSGVASSIKPTAALLAFLQLGALYVTRPDLFLAPTPAVRRYVVPVALMFVTAPAVSLLFLLREHALLAFLDGLHGIVPYYAGLGHRPPTYVLVHSLSPILPLVLPWLAVLLLRPPWLRPYRDLPRTMLLAGTLFGLLNCLVQQRALPYYRYPLLAFLLPLIARDLTAALGAARIPNPKTRRSATAFLLALAGLAFAGLFLAPQSAILIHRYRPAQTDMLTSLQADLERLGGPTLSHRIQCIDSVSGCNTVLFRMRLEPATGILSDFLLFGNTTDPAPPEAIPILRDTRAGFAAALLAHPPEVVVVTSHLHMSGPENFAKLARWPAFADLLATRYTLSTVWSPTRPERWWSREELPAAYRIYTLRHAP